MHRVRIDDRRIRQIPLDVVRSSIGYVPQDVFLFSDTVGNNIAFGAPDADEELLRREGLYADLYRKQLLEQEIAELG